MFVCVAADLCVAEGYALTQSVDVLLTGVVQLRLQADVLRLQGEDLVDLQKTETSILCKVRKTKVRAVK